MSRWLVVHPGASYATGDLHVGYVKALRALGVEIKEYQLDARLDDNDRFYKWLYKNKGLGKPPWDLVVTKACADIVPQALYHDVDGVLVVSGMYLAPDFLVLLKRAGIPTALLLTESPYDDPHQARILARRERGVPVVDVAFTNERASLPYLRQFHPNVHYLGHAFDPHTSRPNLIAPAPEHDVLFIGTMFEERAALLAGVDWEGINFGIYGYHDNLPSRHRLRKYIRGEIVPNRLAQGYYRRAKVNINSYRTSRGFGRGVEHIEHAESLNPRALELAACGAFQVSEHRAEVAEVFGDLVPTYAQGDSTALESTVRYFLEHEGERHARAKALPAAVSGHTYAARAADLMATIEAAWSPRGRGYAGGGSCAPSA